MALLPDHVVQSLPPLQWQRFNSLGRRNMHMVPSTSAQYLPAVLSRLFCWACIPLHYESSHRSTHFRIIESFFCMKGMACSCAAELHCRLLQEPVVPSLYPNRNILHPTCHPWLQQQYLHHPYVSEYPRYYHCVIPACLPACQCQQLYPHCYC